MSFVFLLTNVLLLCKIVTVIQLCGTKIVTNLPVEKQEIKLFGFLVEWLPIKL